MYDFPHQFHILGFPDFEDFALYQCFIYSEYFSSFEAFLMRFNYPHDFIKQVAFAQILLEGVMGLSKD
jgi:hypothetical protein